MSLNFKSQIALLIALTGINSIAFADGWDPNSRATNFGSIANTRHNLTLSYSVSTPGNPSLAGAMDQARNNYGAICVYCHTPHGANKQINAPLWNRTINPGSYTIYDRPTTIGLAGRLNLPGPNSLTCLSCHDGTIAIDSILNMPGSGGYGNNEFGPIGNTDFLDQWIQPARVGHFTLGDPAGAANSVANGTCANGSCHGAPPGPGSARADFRVFVLGEDLRDDHVIGITFPTTFGPGIDYNQPEVVVPNKWAYFDSNGSGFAEKYEVRLYDSGNGPAVECASCHDPHGIPTNNDGSGQFIPSFLRISNSAPNANGIGGPSGLCLTCHAK